MSNFIAMKNFLYLVMFLAGSHCCLSQNADSISLPVNKSTVAATGDSPNPTKINYTDLQLVSFLDSIGKLSTNELMAKVGATSDSIFRNRQQLHKALSKVDFNKLKKAINAGIIDISLAKRIFGDADVDSVFKNNNTLALEMFSFDKNKNDFNEFAVCLGSADWAWSCVLYFFKSDTMIARHDIYHHYGLELKHFRDIDGRTLIYYKENFVSGSGIWWFNYNFYKYYDNKLIPVLNELENGNCQYPWGYRSWWLQSVVQNTKPLILKIVYNIQLPDTGANNLHLVNDSTFVRYIWDEKATSLIGNYDNNKLSKAQIMSFYVNDSEILFINAYYQTLKAALNNRSKRNAVLTYLNEVKNYYKKL